MVTLNLHSQPRLPGSVVGERSMRERKKRDKITKGNCPEVTWGAPNALGKSSKLPPLDAQPLHLYDSQK